MNSKKFLMVISIFLALFILGGCNNQKDIKSNTPTPKSDANTTASQDNKTEESENTDSVEDIDVDRSDVAEHLSYSSADRSLYIAGMKVFDEFSTSNEGSVSLSADGKILDFNMTKATGSVTGALDGPTVYFKMDLGADKIVEKRFDPAPDYNALGKTEFAEHSNEKLELEDARMIEIGKYFKVVIDDIEKN